MTQKTQKADLGIIGVGGSQSAWFRDYLPDEGVYAAQLYQQIRDTDPVVGGIFMALEGMFRQVTWKEVPANDSAAAQEWATFLAEARADMSHTWASFVAEVLTKFVHGWSYFEVVYKIRRGPDQDDAKYRSRYNDGRIGWRKFSLRPQRTLSRWEFDGDGGIQGMWQSTPKGVVFIPIQRALHFRTTESEGNPEGRSLLTNARRAYRYQSRLEEFEAVGIERDLAGIPHVTVPVEHLSPDASPAEQATVKMVQDMAAGLRADERAFVLSPAEEWTWTDAEGKVHRLPTGYSFKLLSSGGTRAHNTDAIIKRYSQRIATSFLASFLLLGGSEGKGAQALSADLTQLFELASTGFLDGMTEVINRFAVGTLMKLNGVPPELWPRLEHGGLSDAALKNLLNQLATIMNAGGITPDNNLETKLRQMLDLPEKAASGQTDSTA